MSTAEKQRKGRGSNGRFEKGNSFAFKPGESPNPGGKPKGSSVVGPLRRLLAMKTKDLKAYRPKTHGERLAKRLALAGMDLDEKQWLSVINSVMDRADGRAVAEFDDTYEQQEGTTVELRHIRRASPPIPGPGSKTSSKKSTAERKPSSNGGNGRPRRKPSSNGKSKGE